MPEKEEDVEKSTEKKPEAPDAELSEKELEQTAGGIGEQYGREATPKIIPYVEQDNLRK